MGVRLSLPVHDREEIVMIGYFKSCFDELKNKVSWPTLSQLQTSSLVVGVCSILIALIVYIMDISSRKLIDLFFYYL